MPRVMQVIEVEELRGNGTKENIYRRVRVYYTLDGECLAAAADPYEDPAKCAESMTKA